MSDLSIPAEAADWATAWIRHAESPNFTATPELLTYRHTKVVERVNRVCDALDACPVNRVRCRDAIRIMREILRLSEVA